MKNITVLIVLITIAAWGCRKDEKSSSDVPVFGKLEVIKGNDQSGYFGEFLSDSIILKASSNNNHRRYLIRFEIIEGNGNVITGYNERNAKSVIVDSTGIVRLNWQLGCTAIQKIKFLVYVDSTKIHNGNQYYYFYYSKPSDSLTITANGTKPKGWGKSCGCNGFDIFTTKIISYDKSTLYLVNYGLYSSTDGGVNWNKVNGIPDWEDIVDAQFNSSGWLYVLTRNNGVCFSKDLKQWQYINNGIIDHRDPTAFLVEDSALFVSFYFDGPYKTTNNGGFWRKMLVGGDAQRFYHITRHPNGNIYLIDDWGDVWISTDYGNLWKRLSISYNYTGGILYDLKIDKDGLIYFGGNDAIISILNPLTYEGEFHRYYQWNGSSQEIRNIQITKDNVYYLVIGNPRSGIYSKLNNWDLLNIGFSEAISYYYLKPDKTFMILSNDGLYYYNTE